MRQEKIIFHAILYKALLVTLVKPLLIVERLLAIWCNTTVQRYDAVAMFNVNKRHKVREKGLCCNNITHFL